MLHGTLAVVPGQMVDCLCSVIASSLQDESEEVTRPPPCDKWLGLDGDGYQLEN